MTQKKHSRVLRQQVHQVIVRALAARSEIAGASQTVLGQKLKITQPRVSALLAGKLQDFSLDMLVDLAARLGVKIRLGG